MSATALISLNYYTLLGDEMQCFFDFFVTPLKFFDPFFEVKPLLDIMKTIRGTGIQVIKLLIYKTLDTLEFFVDAIKFLIDTIELLINAFEFLIKIFFRERSIFCHGSIIARRSGIASRS